MLLTIIYYFSGHARAANYNLKGRLLVELTHLPHLQVLNLYKNNLSGSLPPQWGSSSSEQGLGELQIIRLDQNDLTGTIPIEWCQLNEKTLEQLILANNDLAGSIPSCLSRLTRLKDFSVLNNELSGSIPSSLGNLSNLEVFHSAGNRLRGEMPQTICDLKNRHLLEASTDCLNPSSTDFVECSCCSKCCDGDDEENCKLMGV